MTEWADQIAELQRNWAQQQRKLMTDWLESMKSAGGSTGVPDWSQAADMMQQQVNSALDAQKRSLRAVTGKMAAVEGAPRELNEAVQQLEQGIDRWAEMQRQMWQVWLDLLRQTSAKPQTPGEAMMKSWEEMAQRAVSMQEQWLSSWGGGRRGAASASGTQGGQASQAAEPPKSEPAPKADPAPKAGQTSRARQAPAAGQAPDAGPAAEAKPAAPASKAGQAAAPGQAPQASRAGQAGHATKTGQAGQSQKKTAKKATKKKTKKSP